LIPLVVEGGVLVGGDRLVVALLLDSLVWSFFIFLCF